MSAKLYSTGIKPTNSLRTKGAYWETSTWTLTSESAEECSDVKALVQRLELWQSKPDVTFKILRAWSCGRAGRRSTSVRTHLWTWQHLWCHYTHTAHYCSTYSGLWQIVNLLKAKSTWMTNYFKMCSIQPEQCVGYCIPQCNVLKLTFSSLINQHKYFPLWFLTVLEG